MPSPRRLFVIDGSSQMYRAYHAIRGLSGPDGRSTNAVYGFVTMLRKLITDHTPEYVVSAFDVRGRTFRSDIAVDYKANRAPMPPDLEEQVPFVLEACEALGVPVLTRPGFEADDVIGTLTNRAAEQGFEVVVVTGDKDLFQLVKPGVRVFNPRDEGTWFDAQSVETRFGVRPEQVVDVMALMGDAIDNIKGVPGIGEKGARDLIARFGSLDALLERRSEIAQRKYREALEQHEAQARQSRELAEVRTDLPLDVEIESLRYVGPSRAKCFELFSRLGFRTLLPEFAPTADTVESDYRVAASLVEIDQLAAALRSAGRFAFEVVADGPSSRRATLAGLAISIAPRTAVYVPVGHTALHAGAGLDRAAVLARLGPVFESDDIAKVGHDLKRATLVLSRYGVRLRGVDVDTMLASYVLDATRSSHDVGGLALERLGYRPIEEESVRGKGARAGAFADLPVDLVVPFACERADLETALADSLSGAMVEAALTDVYRTLELPLIDVLADLEQAGISVDVPTLGALSERVACELETLERRIHELADGAFNINSPRQLSEVLFGKLQLPTSKRTGKTRTASTAVDVLEELALAHELPRLVLNWRGLQKLKGTYLDALPALVDPETGRVHTSFNQAVAATGRLSSSDPNLQNIPIRTELGREIRGAFVARPGWVLISADYSQIELRVLAHLSGDEALKEAFGQGIDIHDRTAATVFGSDSGLGKHELRRRAKIINYALVYGKTAHTLAKDIGVSRQAAQDFIDAYFAGYPGVQRFIDDTIADARERGYVSTMAGRRRAVPEITSRNGQLRAAAERIAVNMPIQGTAADILKRAMIDLHRALGRAAPADVERPRMILTVHDELLLEAPEDAADRTVALTREVMEAAGDLIVPLTVDVGVGKNWREAKG